MTPEQEHLARQRGHEVALLRWHWDGAYQFGHDGTAYWARRADTGDVLSHPELAEFREMVRMDYCHRPVPRDATTD